MNGNNNLAAFIGGSIGAMTHYINSIPSLLSLQAGELLDYTVHSLIGGAIMLSVKVLGEWMLHKMKNRKKKE